MIHGVPLDYLVIGENTVAHKISETNSSFHMK